MEYTSEEIQQRIADTDTALSKETIMLYAGIVLLVLLVLGILIMGWVKKRRNTR